MPLSRSISVFLGAVALLASGCRSKETSVTDAPPVAPVVIASRTALSNKLNVAGEFLPFEEVELHAKVAGYIRKINVDIGDHVRAGEVLATLDVPELNAQVVGATASVAQSR